MNGYRRSTRRQMRAGFTLVELTVSLLSATVLMMGLGSAIYLSAQTLDGNSRAAARSRAADVQSEMMRDIAAATSVVSRSATAVTIRVPDRDGDGQAETLAYAWSADTQQLTLSINGGLPAVLLENVQSFSFSFLDRNLTAETSAPPPLNFGYWGARWD